MDKTEQCIGVAGTGISNCGRAIAVSCDITDRSTIASMLENTLLAYGGLDSIVVTAGIFFPPDKSGRIEDRQWDRTFFIILVQWTSAPDDAELEFVLRKCD